APQRLTGAAGGYAAVSFLTGDRLWVGGANEAPARGGLAFDFRERRVEPPQGNPATDAPPGEPVKWEWDDQKRQVRVRGLGPAFQLRRGEAADAVAYLPAGAAGAAWMRGGGFAPVVAVAHTDRGNTATLVTLFDAKTGRRLRQLSGPLLPVRALAFSGIRPLLAGVGDDPTVFVWSLKDLGTPEGM